MVATAKRERGQEHPNTLTCEAYLAYDLRALGRSDEAARLITHVIEARRRVLGPEHPDTKSAEGFLKTLD
jgi:hypothetical protein